MATPWSLIIDTPSTGGLAPFWFRETYPSFGNKIQAGSMQNMDLTNLGYMTQGPGLSTLTNGTEGGAVTTLIRGIISQSQSNYYGTGGNKVYQVATSTSTVTSGVTWPHTIDKGAVTSEDGQSVVMYRSELFFFYTHSGSAGDIGKVSSDFATIDDDWGSTVPTGGAALGAGATGYPVALGGNDTFAFGNGRYVGVYDGTTLNTQALDLPSDASVVDIKWNLDKWWITANNLVSGSIYIWDGTSDTWEAEINFRGYAGASIVKENVFYQFYYSPSGNNKLAYVDGNSLKDLIDYPETATNFGVPKYYQVSIYKDHIIWDASGSIYAFGPITTGLSPKLFQYADSGYSTTGGLYTPLHTVNSGVERSPVVASNQSSSYKLARLSGYDTASNWKSLMFDITSLGNNSSCNAIRINFEVLASGARVDWSLKNNKGQTIYSDIISFTKLGAVTTALYKLNKKVMENFRIEFDYTSGSATNPVSIKSVKFDGTRD